MQKCANLVELENAAKCIFVCELWFRYNRERARQKLQNSGILKFGAEGRREAFGERAAGHLVVLRHGRGAEAEPRGRDAEAAQRACVWSDSELGIFFVELSNSSHLKYNLSLTCSNSNLTELLLSFVSRFHSDFRYSAGRSK